MQEDGQLPLLHGSNEEFVARLLTDRIRALGTVGSSVIEILKVAAILGLRFRRSEVSCASGRSTAETADDFVVAVMRT